MVGKMKKQERKWEDGFYHVLNSVSEDDETGRGQDICPTDREKRERMILFLLFGL